MVAGHRDRLGLLQESGLEGRTEGREKEGKPQFQEGRACGLKMAWESVVSHAALRGVRAPEASVWTHSRTAQRARGS